VLLPDDQKGSTEKVGEKMDLNAEKQKKLGGYTFSAYETADIFLLKEAQIEITTHIGLVKLNGILDSEQLVARAVGLVETFKNVKSMQNERLFKFAGK